MTLFKFDGYIFTDEFDPAFPGYKKKGKYAPLHNYVYWLHTGKIPVKGESVVHHIDENKENNEFDNLEFISVNEHIKYHLKPCFAHGLTSRSKVSLNNKRKCIFGFVGVEFDKRIKPYNKSWRTRITYNGKAQPLSYFHDPLSCEIVYKFVQNEIYGIYI